MTFTLSYHAFTFPNLPTSFFHLRISILFAPFISSSLFTFCYLFLPFPFSLSLPPFSPFVISSSLIMQTFPASAINYSTPSSISSVVPHSFLHLARDLTPPLCPPLTCVTPAHPTTFPTLPITDSTPSSLHLTNSISHSHILD